MDLCTAEKSRDLITDLKNIVVSLVVLPRYLCVVLTLPMCVVGSLHHLPIHVSQWLSAHFLHEGNPFHVVLYVKLGELKIVSLTVLIIQR